MIPTLLTRFAVKVVTPLGILLFIFGLVWTHRFLADQFQLIRDDREVAADVVADSEHFREEGLTAAGEKMEKLLRPQPKRTDDIYAYSRSLSQSTQLISEAQRLSEQIIRDVIKNKTKVVLLDLASIENKGDPAINLGQLFLLARLDFEIIFYCDYFCERKGFDQGLRVAEEYNSSEVVVMSTGGGNFGGYPFNDHKRFLMMTMFRDFQFVLLSQSAWFWNAAHLKRCVTEYSKHPDLTILLRDETSFSFTRKNFPAVRSVLAPDMVFNIGHVKRFMRPLYDIMWIERGDDESPGQSHDRAPDGVSFVRGDWFQYWLTPMGSGLLDDTLMRTYNGFLFLLRGKVVITDRLHGFIMSQLLDIPTVIIDNKIKKISSYRNTWASGLEKVAVAVNGSDALEKAMHFLDTYRDSLPSTAHRQLFSNITIGS